MAIGGEKRESKDFQSIEKYVGLFEARVIAINPTAEELDELLGRAAKEDSKALEYLGESKDGNTYLRVDIWLEEIKVRTVDDKAVNEKFKVTFFLEDKERENKDKTKTQYINDVGVCCWADDPNNLQDWFKTRAYRIANVGEEDFYNFLRMWLYNFDYRSERTELKIEWKKILRGNLKEIKDLIGSEWSANIVPLATIEVKDKDGEKKVYQRIYNKAFLNPYTMKFFRAVDYDDEDVIDRLKAKKYSTLKPYEKFVVDVKDGTYGCKDFYKLKDMKPYNPEDNIVASDAVLSSDSPDY